MLKLNEETHRLTLLFSVRPRVRTRITHAYIKARVEVERDTLEAPSICIYISEYNTQVLVGEYVPNATRLSRPGENRTKK